MIISIISQFRKKKESLSFFLKRIYDAVNLSCHRLLSVMDWSLSAPKIRVLKPYPTV